MSHSQAELEALRRLVRNSNDMLCRHAPDGTYQFVSPACRSLLGYEPDELLGTSPYDLFHPEDLERITASHEQVLETLDRHTVRYRIRHADGHWVWFETTSQTSRDPETGEAVEIHTSSRDITERRRSGEELRRVNEELARSNAELERFATVVSHDLRSPLAVMRGALDLLPRVAGELPPQAEHLVERALANSEERLATVDALLDLARVGRGEGRPLLGADPRMDLERILRQRAERGDGPLFLEDVALGGQVLPEDPPLQLAGGR